MSSTYRLVVKRCAMGNESKDVKNADRRVNACEQGREGAWHLRHDFSRETRRVQRSHALRIFPWPSNPVPHLSSSRSADQLYSILVGKCVHCRHLSSQASKCEPNGRCVRVLGATHLPRIFSFRRGILAGYHPRSMCKNTRQILPGSESTVH